LPSDPSDARGPITVARVDQTADLLRRARAGDDRALEQFVRLTQADVWRFCSYLASPAEADDLTQETYLRAFRAAARFRFESSARTWLFSIARRVAADHVRQATRRRRAEARLTAVDNGPGLAADPAEAVSLDAVVRSLSDDRRAAFVLTQVFGLRYEDAAEACGCEVGTIRSRVFRARDEIRAAISDDSSAEQL
jgi:RNA polymerase sigma-70 factor (ECF subfamily)